MPPWEQPRTPPVNRMTNWCKNITLPQTSFAGGNYSKLWLSGQKSTDALIISKLFYMSEFRYDEKGVSLSNFSILCPERHYEPSVNRKPLWHHTHHSDVITSHTVLTVTPFAPWPHTTLHPLSPHPFTLRPPLESHPLIPTTTLRPTPFAPDPLPPPSPQPFLEPPLIPTTTPGPLPPFCLLIPSTIPRLLTLET